MLELMLVDDDEPFALKLAAAFGDVRWHIATNEIAVARIAAETFLDGAVLDLRATGEERGWGIADRLDAPVLVLLHDHHLPLVIEAQRRGVEISFKNHWETAVDAFCGRLRACARSRVGLVARTRGLTAREREVFQLFAGGLDQQTIATELEIARRTVRAHLASIRTKCRLTSSADLRLLVRQEALRSTDD
jgi:DNA-binding NarL/FixJ family response regulator